MRSAEIARETRETSISLELELDGEGDANISTGIGFFDHMLDAMCRFGLIDLELKCTGDMQVDAHHTTEDCALVLGGAILEALGDRAGIARVGYGRVPMDEALSEVTLDISGRPWLEWHGDEYLPPVIAREEKDVWREFYKALASAARMNVHVAFLYGKNGHHLLESAAKGLGLALAAAVKREGTQVRSTKGGLD